MSKALTVRVVTWFATTATVIATTATATDAILSPVSIKPFCEGHHYSSLLVLFLVASVFQFYR